MNYSNQITNTNNSVNYNNNYQVGLNNSNFNTLNHSLVQTNNQHLNTSQNNKVNSNLPGINNILNSNLSNLNNNTNQALLKDQNAEVIDNYNTLNIVTPKIIFTNKYQFELYYNESNNLKYLYFDKNFDCNNFNNKEEENFENNVFHVLELLKDAKLKNFKSIISFFEKNNFREPQFVLNWINIFSEENFFQVSSNNDKSILNTSSRNNMQVSSGGSFNNGSAVNSLLSDSNYKNIKNIFLTKIVPGIFDMSKLMNSENDDKIIEMGYLKCYKSELRDFIISCISKLGHLRDDEIDCSKYKLYNPYLSADYLFRNKSPDENKINSVKNVNNSNFLKNDNEKLVLSSSNYKNTTKSEDILKKHSSDIKTSMFDYSTSNNENLNQYNINNINNINSINNSNLQSKKLVNNLNINSMTTSQIELVLERLAYALFSLNTDEINYISKSIVQSSNLKSELINLCVILPKVITFMNLNDSPYQEILVVNYQRIKNDEDQTLLSFIYSFVLGESNSKNSVKEFINSQKIHSGLKLLYLFSQSSVQTLKEGLSLLQEFCTKNVKIRGLVLFGTSEEAAKLISSYIDKTDNLIVGFILSKFFVPMENRLSYKLNYEFNEFLNKLQLFNLRIELNHRLSKIVDSRFEENFNDLETDKIKTAEKKGKKEAQVAEYQLTCHFCLSKIQDSSDTKRNPNLNSQTGTAKKEIKQLVSKYSFINLYII
jgi:hypothetical protein